MSKTQPINPSAALPPVAFKERRSFTEEFKREAVRLARERGNVSSVARDLGIVDSVLARWKRQLQNNQNQGSTPFPGNGNPRDTEMAKLQREQENRYNRFL